MNGKIPRGALLAPAFIAGLAVMAIPSGPAEADAAFDAESVREAEDTHIVVEGETLGDIALKRTGSVGNSDVIFRMNADTISNPDEITPGMVLKLPRAGIPSPGQPRGRSFVGEDAPWRAMAGDLLVPVLSDWGAKAGYAVVVDHDSDWIFGVDFSAAGDFRAAVAKVIAGFGNSAVPPFVVFYGNDVMTIGVR